MVTVLITGLFAAVWFAFASQQALRTLGDPVTSPSRPNSPLRYPQVRKDVGRASGQSLAILIAELDSDFDRVGLAFVEYWNPGADLLAFRFRMLRAIATVATPVVPPLARWAVWEMAAVIEWGFRAVCFVPVSE